MNLGFPTRGRDTDRRCPACKRNEAVQRIGETARTSTGLVVKEHYLCHPDREEGCGYRWEVDTYGEGIYRE